MEIKTSNPLKTMTKKKVTTKRLILYRNRLRIRNIGQIMLNQKVNGESSPSLMTTVIVDSVDQLIFK